MEGMKILNQYVGDEFGMLQIIYMILLPMVIIALINGLVKSVKDINNGNPLIYGIVFNIIWFLWILFATFSIFQSLTDKHNIYDVIIEDSVSYAEFTEKYKVLEVNGDIYTIREIEEK